MVKMKIRFPQFIYSQISLFIILLNLPQLAYSKVQPLMSLQSEQVDYFHQISALKTSDLKIQIITNSNIEFDDKRFLRAGTWELSKEDSQMIIETVNRIEKDSVPIQNGRGRPHETEIFIKGKKNQISDLQKSYLETALEVALLSKKTQLIYGFEYNFKQKRFIQNNSKDQLSVICLKGTQFCNFGKMARGYY